LKGHFFRNKLAEYIHHTLDLKEYEAFFDELNEVDPVLLQQWISEILEAEEEGARARIPIPDLSRVHQQVLQKVYAIDPPVERKTRKITYWIWASSAAVLLCLFSLLYIFSPNIQEEAVNKSMLSWYENSHHYTIDMQLPDSSIAILYPHAKISYVLNEEGKREIKQVQGKVIYKVHKNPKAPFTVNYRGYVTKALGTVFSVDPQADENILIKLLEGKVSVGLFDARPQDLVYLNGNEEVKVDLRLHTMTKMSAKVLEKSRLARVDKKLSELIPSFNANVAWSSQSVEFSQTKNTQLLQVIENLYEVSIICESPELRSNSFTGSLNRKEPLEKFLTNFCQLNGCSFRLDNGIVTLSNSARKEDPN